MTLVAEKRNEMKVRVRKPAPLARFLLSTTGKVLLISLAVLTVAAMGTFTYYYTKYSHLIDTKLHQGPFANTSKIFAAPRTLSVGDTISTEDIGSDLHRAGYNQSESNPMGYYRLRPDGIEIYPGADSYFKRDAALLKLNKGKIVQILSLSDHTE